MIVVGAPHLLRVDDSGGRAYLRAACDDGNMVLTDERDAALVLPDAAAAITLGWATLAPFVRRARKGGRAASWTIERAEAA